MMRVKRMEWFLAKHGIDAKTANAVYDALDELPDKVLVTIDEEIIDEMVHEGIDPFTLEKVERPLDYFEREKCGTCIYFDEKDGCTVAFAPLGPKVSADDPACEMWDDGRFGGAAEE